MSTTDDAPTNLDEVTRDAPDDERPALAATAAAAQAAARVRDALDDLHTKEDEAWEHYSEAVRQATSEAEAELAIAVARLRAERAASHEDLGLALDQAVESLRGRIDEARVRAHLGRRELESRTEEALDELERTARDLRQISGRLVREAAHDLDALRHDTLRGIGAAAGALRRLVASRAEEAER